MVVARFTVQKFECTAYTPWQDGKPLQTKEMRTIVLAPVYSSDPADPNKKFWESTPSGEIRLGTINPEAWQAFELNGLYEVTFKKVEPSNG